MSPIFLLILLMLLGGNAGSTAGGIKTDRMAWLTKGVWSTFKQIWHSGEGEPLIFFNGKLQNPYISKNNIQQAGEIFFLWMVSLAIGTLALSIFAGDQYSFYQILFDAASALNNVGLSAGLTGPELPDPAKYILIFLMWLGRLEITAVLVLLISPLYF